MERPADIETGEFNKQASLVYSYGASTPSENFKLYTTLITSMAAMFRERCTARPASEAPWGCPCDHVVVCQSQPRLVGVSSTPVVGWKVRGTRL